MKQEGELWVKRVLCTSGKLFQCVKECERERRNQAKLVFHQARINTSDNYSCMRCAMRKVYTQRSKAEVCKQAEVNDEGLIKIEFQTPRVGVSWICWFVAGNSELPDSRCSR